MSYSLFDDVTEGPLKNWPRWALHLSKVGIGAAFLAAYYWMFRLLPLWVAAMLASFVWFASNRVQYSLNMGTPIVKPDLWTDMATHCSPFAALLWVEGFRLAAVLVFAALAAVWWLTHTESSP